MKREIKNIVSVSVFTLVFCVIISVLLVTMLVSNLKTNINNVIDVAQKNCVKLLSTNLENQFEILNNYKTQDINLGVSIPKQYVGLGLVDKNLSFNYVVNDKCVTNDTDIFYNNTELDDAEKNVFNICINGVNYISYSIKNGDGYNIFLQDISVFLQQIELYNFSDLKILNNSKKIVYSYLPANKPYLELEGVNNFDYITVNNEEFLIVCSDIGDFNLKLVTYTSSNLINKFKAKTITNIALFVVLLIAIVIIACGYMIYNLIHLDFKSLYKEGKVYFVKINNRGKIISEDNAFAKNFNVDNIFECAEDKKTLNAKLNGGCFVLNLTDYNMQKKYVMCRSYFDGSYYRLIGNDITEVYAEFLNSKKILNGDTTTGLMRENKFYEDFDTYKKDNCFEYLGIAIIEIQNLKTLKTMFGNRSINKLQKSIADKLKNIFEPDINVYFSVEEKFIIFSNSTVNTELLLSKLNICIAELESPINIDDNTIRVFCKAGFYKIEDKISAKDCLNLAGVALKYSKIAKNKDIAIYDSRIMKSAELLFDTKESILAVINSKDFEVFFQPQYSVSKKQIIGFEALSRFKSFEYKHIEIQEFFDVAEKNGAIIELGTVIYEKAMAFAKQIEGKDISVSLNVSPIQLMQEGFSEKFLKKYTSLALKNNSICIEITESFMMENYDDIIGKLRQLKNKGINIHLDDFGIAYSSMLYLNRLPINSIKIDREFVRDINVNEYTKTIVEFMLKLSKNLGLECVIEGIETKEQLEQVCSLGGDIIQGYIISAAVQKDSAIKLIENFHLEN